jgi:hypothetical protein
MQFEDKIPNVKLTVVIRDIAPFVHMQEAPTHRTVHIELTDQQKDLLRLSCVGQVGGRPMHEELDKAFLEYIV